MRPSCPQRQRRRAALSECVLRRQDMRRECRQAVTPHVAEVELQARRLLQQARAARAGEVLPDAQRQGGRQCGACQVQLRAHRRKVQ